MSDPNRVAEKARLRQEREDRYQTTIADHAAHGVEFVPFPKIPRLNRNITITEKIDGTNAAIHITGNWIDRAGEVHAYKVGDGLEGPDEIGRVVAQSRSRLLTPEEDNFGFARWVQENAQQLRELLGPGIHFGEWWGKGIQRGYKQERKWFSLFNYNRWANDPNIASMANIGVQVIPVLYHGPWMAVVGGSGDVYPPVGADTLTLDESIDIETGGPIAIERVESILSRRGKGVLRYAPDLALEQLAARGSVAAHVNGIVYKKNPESGDKGPEGIVVYHEAGRVLFKATIDGDEAPKTQIEALHEQMLRELEKEGF